MKKTLISLVLLFLVFIFWGQVPDRPYNDDDPRIEQPTREAMSRFVPPNQTPAVVTIDDYDNFNVGVDYYEQWVTSNPNNPPWIFFGVNKSSPPQNAWGTTDGGLTWYLNNPQYPAGTCCDPWAAYTGSGVLIYASGVNGQYVYRSTNNGLTWSAPILSVSGVDRNHVEAEYTGLGPYANYAYACITPGNFGRSTDAGLTWQTTYTPSNSLPGCYIAVGPNGSIDGGCVIYVTNTGSDYGNRVYNFHRSTDGGATFTLMSSQTGWAGFVGYHTGSRHTINNVRTAPHPKIAMDNSNGPYRGRLYFVNASNDPPGNGNKPDIWLRYSTDQGATWSTRVRVNDNANPQLSDQWFPEIWCDRFTGTLYIHWYDTRNGPATFQCDRYATYTTDGGQTFAPNQRITNQTWTWPNPPCSPNCYRGDYTGVTANALTSFSVWGDHRNGTALNMGGYFPDFAMRVKPDSSVLHPISDSSFHYVSIPGVKLWNKTTKFSATVVPTPGTGTIALTLMNRTTGAPLDSLTTYPDSLRMRIRTSGGVTQGNYTVTVKGFGTNGTPVHTRVIYLTVWDFVGIAKNETMPDKFYLYQNYPNPFNAETVIRYQLSVNSAVSLRIYDVSGRIVAEPLNKKQGAGVHEISFDANNFPTGVYFYELVARQVGSATGEYKSVRKMVLVK